MREGWGGRGRERGKWQQSGDCPKLIDSIAIPPTASATNSFVTASNSHSRSSDCWERLGAICLLFPVSFFFLSFFFLIFNTVMFCFVCFFSFCFFFVFRFDSLFLRVDVLFACLWAAIIFARLLIAIVHPIKIFLFLSLPVSFSLSLTRQTMARPNNP